MLFIQVTFICKAINYYHTVLPIRDDIAVTSHGSKCFINPQQESICFKYIIKCYMLWLSRCQSSVNILIIWKLFCYLPILVVPIFVKLMRTIPQGIYQFWWYQYWLVMFLFIDYKTRHENTCYDIYNMYTNIKSCVQYNNFPLYD